jgi:hypothetical protein
MISKLSDRFFFFFTNTQMNGGCILILVLDNSLHYIEIKYLNIETYLTRKTIAFLLVFILYSFTNNMARL